MADPVEKGVLVTPKTISTILGAISLIAVIFTAVTTLNSYAYRIETLETRNVELLSSADKLVAKIDELNVKIIDLTITLNRLEERIAVRSPASVVK